VLAVALLCFQPLDLTLTEIRLRPDEIAPGAGLVIAVLVVAFWAAWELGRPSVRDEIMRAGIKRWDMTMPAQAGGGVVALVAFMLWLTLHGQSAQLAESLASQQLGPDYRYHLTWISSTKTDKGTSVRGTVTAWNEREIKTVLLHWETH
jgi:hypothetical protein